MHQAQASGAQPPEGWALQGIRLQDFRSYTQLSLRLGTQLILLLGPNGAGKTNLLEAVSLLAGGRGLRGAAREDLARRQAGQDTRRSPWLWSLAAQIETPLGARSLGLGQSAAALEGESAKRHIELDGKPIKRGSALASLFPQVWLTPQQGNFFVGPAEERRRFMDTSSASLLPEQAGHQAAYSRAMRERARLLRDARATGSALDGRWLDALEDTMSRHGVAQAVGRRRWLEGLAALGTSAQAPFPSMRLGLSGWVEQAVGHAKPVDVEADLRARLAASRDQDQALARTHVGPHRADLLVQHADKDVEAALCSTGEQKALLVGLMLGQARLIRQVRGMAPILLLDDLAAFLDQERRQALFAALPELSAQIWLSGTEESLFAPLTSAENLQAFSLDASQLKPL